MGAEPESEQGGSREDLAAASLASDTGRLETFADGVLAIAITLLILEVKVPKVPAGGSLATALLDEWPSYAGYAVSFLTIGVIWVNHHHMFKLIQRANHAFLMINVVFLMTISFLPWPTALVAAFLRNPSGRIAATVTYGLTMVAIAIMFNVVWRYAVARGLVVSDLDEAAVAKASRNYLAGPTVYSIATILAFWNPFASLTIFAALAVYWLLPGTGPRATLPRSAGA